MQSMKLIANISFTQDNEIKIIGNNSFNKCLTMRLIDSDEHVRTFHTGFDVIDSVPVQRELELLEILM